MSAFWIFATCLTVAYIIYYSVVVWRDLSKPKEQVSSSEETFELADTVPEPPAGSGIPEERTRRRQTQFRLDSPASRSHPAGDVKGRGGGLREIPFREGRRPATCAGTPGPGGEGVPACRTGRGAPPLRTFEMT